MLILLTLSVCTNWLPCFAGAIELRNALAMKFGVELPPTLVFDHPTLSSITDYLATCLGLSAHDSSTNFDREAGLRDERLPVVRCQRELDCTQQPKNAFIVSTSSRLPGGSDGAMGVDASTGADGEGVCVSGCMCPQTK